MQNRVRLILIFISLWVYGITYGQVCNLTQIPPNLRESLRAYYPFCGNFQDISGNGYNGTFVGNVPFIADRMGTANAAIQGGGGYVTTSNQFFRFTQSDTFTVSVWFTVPASGCPPITSNYTGRLLSTESAEGHFRIVYYGNGAVSVQFGDYMVDTVTLNVWHHLVYVYANRNERVYMDGVLKVTNYETNTTENLTYATPFTIGAKAAPSYDLWCGNIDEVGVWGRVLSDCEVKQLYRLPNTFSLPIDKEYDPYPNEQFACADSVELYSYRDNCSYRWNTGDTSSSIVVKYSGLYKITVTDTFGCSASDSIRIILSNAEVLQNDTSICVGDSLMLQLKEGSNDPILYDFNECVLADFINTDGGGAASSTVNGLQSCGLNLEWPARVESIRKGFSYGLYEVDMRPSLNIANQYFTVLGVNIDSRPAGTDDEGYGIYVNGAPVKISTIHPAQYPNWYHLRVNITPDSLFVWIDNTQLYAGKHMDFGPAPVSPISIGTFSSSFFDNVRYTPFGANQFIRWSTGDTTRSILVRPVATSVYSVSVTQNGLTCTDSVRVTVNGRTGFNPLLDTIRSCSKYILLDAGEGFAEYQWSNGQNTRQVVADSTGFYRIRATDNNGCSYSDTALVSLLNADIVQSDTLICPGTSVVLSIDSLFPGVLTDRPPSIPASLYTFMQAYYPFSGNTNDYSKNNYTGYGTNVTLTADRFGNPNSAYQFNGVDSRIFIPYQFFNNGWQDYSISLWFSPDSHTGTTGPGQTLFGTLPRYATAIGYSYNDSRRIYHFKNSNTAINGWDILNNDPLNAGPIQMGKWYHLIVVKRGLTYDYYLDGQLDKRVTTTAAPLFENCTLQLGAMMPDNSDAFRGKLDEVMVFDRALDTLQMQQLDVFTPRVRWSTGDTAKSITVVPDSTTSYYVTVTNGISSCSDSVRVDVLSIDGYDPFPDTISVCGDSVMLNAGDGYKSYRWSTGDTSSSLLALQTGYYSVEVELSQGCKAADTVFVSVIEADILNSDTSICQGVAIELIVDTAKINQNCIRYLGSYNGHYYYASCATDFTWTQANAFANRLGKSSSLAIINDNNENVFLSGVTNGQWMWMGLKQDLSDPSYAEPRGAWKWVDGSEATFINWGPGEPNNGDGAEHFACFNNASGVTIPGAWNDGMDIYKFSALIESNEPLESVITSLRWSTGDSTPRITVIPDTTTTYYVTVSNGITSCIDSVRVTVSAIKDFNPFPDSLCVCADSIVLDAGAGFRSYDWSTGDTTQHITVFRKGWHKVTVTNADGCRAEDSVFVRRGFADILQNDTSLRALTPFDLSIDTSYLTENGFKVFWSTGDSTPFITVVPRQKTKYYVRVTDGIVTCTDSITIDVKCIGGFNPCPPKVAKCDRRAVLDAGPGYLSYLWSTGDTTQQITVTSNGYYTVYVFDSSGAFGEDSTFVNLLAITLQPRDTTICSGNSVQLTAGNFFNGNDLILPTFTWATGEQDTALTVTPGETTTYYATLTNANNSCRDSAIVRVVAVDASLSIVGDSVLCENSNDSIVMRAGRGRAYQWFNNGVAIAGATDSLFVTRQAGNFSVVVSDTLGCQDSSRIQSVVLSPLPVGTFLPPASNSFCLGDSVQLVASGADSYRWHLNGIPINGATAARYYAKQAGTYSVVFFSDKGCSSPGDTIVLLASKKPKASFTYTTYCAGISSQFTSTSDTSNAGDVQYLWKFADGSTAGGPDISHVFARSGNYPVQLILSSFDCPNYADTATVNVNVQAPAPGIRYRTLNLTINVAVTLVARPLGNDFLWVPPDGLDNPRVRTPRLLPQQNATYLIRISNTAGCVTTDTLGVQVFDGRDLFVARGFTPNNDGKNDRLYPIAIGIVELRYFRIYNRWGNLIFQSASLLPQDGWDGVYNGKAQPSDTYTWMAEGVDIEGKVIRRSGSSILIR